LEGFLPGEKSEVYAVVELDGKKVFRYMQAQIADQSCLECHGTYESAPTYIQERFPKGHPSYNDKVGDIMGAVSFAKPMGPLYAELADNFKQELSYRAGMLLLFVIATYVVVRRLILGRLKMASTTIHKITTTGSLNERIPTTGSRDEIGQLLGDFNEMMAELNRTTLQREESEIRYRTLIEATRSAIVTFLGNGKIVISNQKAEQLLGLTREELLGENFFDYLVDAEDLQQNITDLTLNSKRQNHKMARLCHIKDAHGRTKEVKIVLVLASDAADKQMFTAILRDPDTV
ncbi:MAG: PAS domain S-box protein, partial [Desulfuromonas sp.]|nr:PAS domain S-box protein [Desulfuromonas sp.]